jgi:hypothetical protein
MTLIVANREEDGGSILHLVFFFLLYLKTNKDLIMKFHPQGGI